MSTDASDNPAPDPSTAELLAIPEMVINGRTVQAYRGACGESGAPIRMWTIPGEPVVLAEDGKTVVKSPTPPWYSRQVSDRRIVEGLMERAGSVHPFAPEAPPAYLDEVEKLRAMGLPTLADVLLKAMKYREAGAIAGRFTLADVFVTRSVNLLAAGREAIAGYLRRHADGDLGAYGHLEGITPTAAQRWCPPLADRGPRSAAAVLDGRGLVVSQFDHSDARDGHEGQTHTLVIVTAITPGRPNLTLVTAPADAALSIFG